MPKDANEKETMPKRPMLHRTNEILSFVFYVLWILIGIFLLIVIYGQIKQGALTSIFGSTQAPAGEVSAPTETELPGLGMVNIECVQSSLEQASLQKLITEGPEALTDDEKSKLEPCIVEAESSQSSPTS